MALSTARKAVAKLDGVGNAALANAVRAVPQFQTRGHDPGPGRGVMAKGLARRFFSVVSHSARTSPRCSGRIRPG